jgi:hypothetical protein
MTVEFVECQSLTHGKISSSTSVTCQMLDKVYLFFYFSTKLFVVFLYNI